MEVFDEALYDYLDDSDSGEDFFDKADRLYDEEKDKLLEGED